MPVGSLVRGSLSDSELAPGRCGHGATIAVVFTVTGELLARIGHPRAPKRILAPSSPGFGNRR